MSTRRGVPAKNLCSGMTTIDGWVITDLKTGLMYPEGYDQAEFMVLATLRREIGDPAGYISSRGEYERTVVDERRTWFDGDEIVELGI